MNYLRRNKPSKFGVAKKYVLTAVVVVVFGALFLSFFGGVFSFAAAPLWKGENILSRGFASAGLWFKSRDALVRETSAMRGTLVSQEAELASLRGVRERELALLEVLGRPVPEQSVIAAVLIRPPQTPYDTLVIDAGTSQGVQVGHTVRMTEGPLLGTVVEAFRRTAKVKLFSSSGERTNAVLERDGIPVILLGQGGGNFRLTLPREVEVAEGDRVFSATMPTELLAIAGKINMAPTDSFKEVLARGASNIFVIRYVIVGP